MSTTTTDKRTRTRRIRRAAVGIATAAAATAGLLAVAPSASANGSVCTGGWVPANGGVAFAAASATSSVTVNAYANSPGLKFKLLNQSGIVIAHTVGPQTSWYIQTSVPAGDYTAEAINNSTQSVYLQSLCITGS